MMQDIYARFGVGAYKILKCYDGKQIRIWKNNQIKQPIIKDFLVVFNEQEVLSFFSMHAGQILSIYSAEAAVIKFAHRKAEKELKGVLSHV